MMSRQVANHPNVVLDDVLGVFSSCCEVVSAGVDGFGCLHGAKVCVQALFVHRAHISFKDQTIFDPLDAHLG